MITTSPSGPPWVNSTAPAESGDANSDTHTSSNASDWRGPRVKVCGAAEQTPMKQRYSAVTVRASV